MGSSSSSNASHNSSRPHSWLFPEEDDCSTGAHSQATGASGIIGELIGGFAGAAGSSIARLGSAGAGFLGGAIGGGLAGADDAFADKYNQCHTPPSCEVSDYVEAAAIKAGAGALIGTLTGLEGAVGGGLEGAASGLIDKYNQCHP